METRKNIYNIQQIFQEFLVKKVVIEFKDNQGKKVNFQKEINDIFQLLTQNKEELYKDLKGKYIK